MSEELARDHTQLDKSSQDHDGENALNDKHGMITAGWWTCPQQPGSSMWLYHPLVGKGRGKKNKNMKCPSSQHCSKGNKH